MRSNECFQTLPAEIEKLLSIVLFLLLRETIFGLGDLKLALSFKSHEADTKVGSTWNVHEHGCTSEDCSTIEYDACILHLLSLTLPHNNGGLNESIRKTIVEKNRISSQSYEYHRRNFHNNEELNQVIET